MHGTEDNSSLSDSLPLAEQAELYRGDDGGYFQPRHPRYDLQSIGRDDPLSSPRNAVGLSWSGWLSATLQASNSPYTPFLHSGLELHVDPLTPVEIGDDLWTDLIADWPIYAEPFPLRIPRNGSQENDSPIAYNPRLIRCAGTSWWNYRKKITEACGIDFDFDHSNAQGAEGIKRIDDLAATLPYVLNCTSKGGLGRHWTVFVQPMEAPTRRHHTANCGAILATLSEELGVDLKKLCCSHGAIMYQYHYKPASNGFRLVKGVSL